MNKIFFPVLEKPLVNPISGLIDNSYKCIMREDTHEVLSVMSGEYKLIPNEEIASIVMSNLDDYGDITETYSNFSNRRFKMKYRFNDMKVNIGNGEPDYLNPEIIIRNSYDGTIQLSILTGAFRLVCSNGLIIGITFSGFKNKHSNNNERIEDIPILLKEAIKSLNAKLDTIKYLNVPFDNDTLPKFYEFLPEPYDKALTEYIVANKPNTYYDMMNALTFIATHNMNREYESTHLLEERIFPFVKSFVS